jgi:hypothetical protein
MILHLICRDNNLKIKDDKIFQVTQSDIGWFNKNKTSNARLINSKWTVTLIPKNNEILMIIPEQD